MDQRKFIIHHIEEISGTIGTMLYLAIVRWKQIFIVIDWHNVYEHVLSEIPLFLASGFFGGLGGHAVRMFFKIIEKRKNKNNKIDE